MSRFQRRRDGGVEQRASNLELFYDLVFVFAVTQVSHLLLNDLTVTGAAHAALALLVVWWAWNYTTWVTNELDPEATVIRLVLLTIMLASLVLAVAIPEAFGARALLFAGAYVGIQVGRHAFLTFVAADRGTIERERAGRILIWFAAAGVLWIAGGLAPSARDPLWVAALALDYGAPVVLYWVPGRERLSGAHWEVETAHFSERFQLFVIIALGETIVSTGATTSNLELTPGRVTAFALAFLTTAAYWWLYFTQVAGLAEEGLEQARDRTTVARNGYTYLHAMLVAGIVTTAVGAELAIAHPGDRLSTAAALAVTAGPALYLTGHALFRLATIGSLAWPRFAGGLVCLALTPLGLVAPALVLLAALLLVLAALIALERLGVDEPEPVTA